MDSIIDAGSEHTLECNVAKISNLVVQPALVWLSPDNHEIASRRGSSVSTTLSSIGTISAGEYTCQVTVTVESVGVHAVGQNSTILRVQSKPE